MPLGPVQLLVVGFDRPDFSGEVLAELERLRESDVVRVIDLLVVHKDADGVVRRLHHSDLSAGEAEGAGAVVGALIGLGARRVEVEATARFRPMRSSGLSTRRSRTTPPPRSRSSSTAGRSARATRSGPLAAFGRRAWSIRPTSPPPASSTPRTQQSRMGDAVRPPGRGGGPFAGADRPTMGMADLRQGLGAAEEAFGASRSSASRRATRSTCSRWTAMRR